MITKNNLKEVLEILNFNSKDKIVYEKFYQNSDKISIKVDLYATGLASLCVRPGAGLDEEVS